jgi:hypothetical protein
MEAAGRDPLHGRCKHGQEGPLVEQDYHRSHFTMLVLGSAGEIGPQTRDSTQRLLPLKVVAAS